MKKFTKGLKTNFKIKYSIRARFNAFLIFFILPITILTIVTNYSNGLVTIRDKLENTLNDQRVAFGDMREGLNKNIDSILSSIKSSLLKGETPDTEKITEEYPGVQRIVVEDIDLNSQLEENSALTKSNTNVLKILESFAGKTVNFLGEIFSGKNNINSINEISDPTKTFDLFSQYHFEDEFWRKMDLSGEDELKITINDVIPTKNGIKFINLNIDLSFFEQSLTDNNMNALIVKDGKILYPKELRQYEIERNVLNDQIKFLNLLPTFKDAFLVSGKFDESQSEIDLINNSFIKINDKYYFIAGEEPLSIYGYTDEANMIFAVDFMPLIDNFIGNFIFTVILSSIPLLAILLFSIMYRKSILDPILSLAKNLEDMDNRAPQPIPSINKHDEIGLIYHVFNENLEEIQAYSEELQASNEELTISNEELSHMNKMLTSMNNSLVNLVSYQKKSRFLDKMYEEIKSFLPIIKMVMLSQKKEEEAVITYPIPFEFDRKQMDKVLKRIQNSPNENVISTHNDNVFIFAYRSQGIEDTIYVIMLYLMGDMPEVNGLSIVEMYLKTIMSMLENRDLSWEIKQSYIYLSRKLTEISEIYDDETGEHIKRVSLYSKFVAEKLNLGKEFVQEIEIFSQLHDIGKLKVPYGILTKNGRLTDTEYEIIKKHSEYGADFIGNMSWLDIARNIALNHHEKYDGSGYPNGLKGEEIPVEARIVALADVYDALRSPRRYKPAFSHEKSFDIIVNGDGRTMSGHFDPEIIKIFVENGEMFRKIYDENL